MNRGKNLEKNAKTWCFGSKKLRRHPQATALRHLLWKILGRAEVFRLGRLSQWNRRDEASLRIIQINPNKEYHVTSIIIRIILFIYHYIYNNNIYYHYYCYYYYCILIYTTCTTNTSVECQMECMPRCGPQQQHAVQAFLKPWEDGQQRVRGNEPWWSLWGPMPWFFVQKSPIKMEISTKKHGELSS